MDNQALTEFGYTTGYGEEVRRMHDRRSAQHCAAHLLPHLKPGLRVLDFGCGNGAISIGLAKAVAPGELHGIDMEESQIALARSAAEAGGHTNATFHLGDLTDLPFEDNFFEVAHCHTVLLHVPDTQAVLDEVKRVLKPGCIISSRERIIASSFLEPSAGDSWGTVANLIVANGGHPQMGRELKGAFLDAGFVHPRASASFDVYSTPEEIAILYDFFKNWLFSPAVIAAATKRGKATLEQLDNRRRALDQWRQHPAAWGAFALGECIAYKPRQAP